MTNNPPDPIEDEFGIPLADYQDALEGVSMEALDQIHRRTTTATTNYLYAFGVPNSPAAALRLSSLVAQTIIATGIVDNAFTLTEAGTASPEERKARGRIDKEAVRDSLQTLAQSINGQNTEGYDPGGYL